VDYGNFYEWLIEHGKYLNTDQIKHYRTEYEAEALAAPVIPRPVVSPTMYQPAPALLSAPMPTTVVTTEPKKPMTIMDLLVCFVIMLISVFALRWGSMAIDTKLFGGAIGNWINITWAGFHGNHIPAGKKELVKFQDDELFFLTKENCQPSWNAMNAKGEVLPPPPLWPVDQRAALLKSNRVGCLPWADNKGAWKFGGHVDMWAMVVVDKDGAYSDGGKSGTFFAVWVNMGYWGYDESMFEDVNAQDMTPMIGKTLTADPIIPAQPGQTPQPTTDLAAQAQPTDRPEPSPVPTQASEPSPVAQEPAQQPEQQPEQPADTPVPPEPTQEIIEATPVVQGEVVGWDGTVSTIEPVSPMPTATQAFATQTPAPKPTATVAVNYNQLPTEGGDPHPTMGQSIYTANDGTPMSAECVALKQHYAAIQGTPVPPADFRKLLNCGMYGHV